MLSPRGRPWTRRSSLWPWSRSLKSLKISLSSARGDHYFLTVGIMYYLYYYWAAVQTDLLPLGKFHRHIA